MILKKMGKKMWIPCVIFSVITNYLFASNIHSLDIQTQELLRSEEVMNISNEKVNCINNFEIYVNGKKLEVSTSILKYEGRLYLPLRDIANFIDAEIEYFNDEKVVVILSSNTRIELPVNMNKCVIIPNTEKKNSEIVYMDQGNYKVSNFIYNNKIYIPVRFVSEIFNYRITYSSNGILVQLTMNDISKNNELVEKENEIKEVEYDGTDNFSYVKPFSEEDIETTIINIDGEDVKKVYVKNQIILSANKGVSFEEIKQLLEKYDGVIVGYIARARRYQVEFTESTYEALCEKIELIKHEDIVNENTVLLNTVKIN